MELFGWIENTSSDSDNIRVKWRIPAQSERLAKRQGMINARIKHGSSCEVLEVKKVREGDLPGQSIYEVTTECER